MNDAPMWVCWECEVQWPCADPIPACPDPMHRWQSLDEIPDAYIDQTPPDPPSDHVDVHVRDAAGRTVRIYEVRRAASPDPEPTP